MAYGVKYTDTCTLRGGETLTINIYKEAYASSTTAIQPAPNGLKLVWGAEDGDVIEPFRAATARLTIIADGTDAFMSDLETGYDTEFLLEVTRASTTLFYGVVDPYRGGRYQRDNAEIVITATDGFEILKQRAWSSSISGRSTVLSVIDDCLGLLPYGSTWGYKTDNVCKPDGVTTGDMLTQVYIDETRYRQYTQDGEYYTWRAYDVLHDIMTRFGLSLSQWNGSWYIQQVPQYQTGTYAEYTYNSTPALTATDATHNNLWTFTSGTNADMVDNYPLVRRAPGYGQINVLYNHESTYEIIKNGSFTEPDDTDPTWAEHWTRTENGTTGTEIYLNTGWNVEIPKAEPPSNQHAYLLAYYNATEGGASPGASVNYMETDTVSLMAGDELTLTFSARLDLANTVPYYNSTRKFWWRLTDGTNYFQKKGAITPAQWTTTPTWNTENILPNNKQNDYEYLLKGLADIPATGVYTLYITTVHDHYVTDDTGGAPAAYDPADWNALSQPGTDPDVVALRVDGVWLDDGNPHPVGLRTWVYEGTDARYRMHDPIVVSIGDGPKSFSDARLTTDSGGNTQTTNWDGLGFTDEDIDSWLGSVYLKYKGKPRLVKTMDFFEITGYMDPVEVLVLDSLRYWPNKFYLDPIGSRFGGTFTELNTQTNTLSSTTYESGSTYSPTGATTTTSGAPSAVTVNVTNNTGLLNVDDLSVIAPSTGSLTIDGDLTISAAGSFTVTNGLVIDDGGMTLLATTTKATPEDIRSIRWTSDGTDSGTTRAKITGAYTTTGSKSSIVIDGVTDVDIDGHATLGVCTFNIGNVDFSNVTAIQTGAVVISDSDSSTGSIGDVLSQDAGGLVWTTPAAGAYAETGTYGRDDKFFAEDTQSNDDTYANVEIIGGGLIGTEFDDVSTITFLRGRVVCYSQSGERASFEIDATVTTNGSAAQTIDNSAIVEQYQSDSTPSSKFVLQLTTSGTPAKVTLQSKDTQNVATAVFNTAATIEYTQVDIGSGA